MKLKLFARRLSVSAPKMTVRRHVPWPLRLASLVAVLVLGAGAVLWLWHSQASDALLEREALEEQVAAHERQRAQLDGQLQAGNLELQRLAALVNAADSRTKVEQTAAERLAAQIRTLEAENARLKADITYLESLLPAGESEGVVAIRRFEVQPDAQPGRMRYRALLVQGGRSERDFEGSLQLLIATEAEGRKSTLTLPHPAASEELIKVSFRRHQRIEGIFAVPAGARVRSVQLRVFEGKTVRAQQTVMM